MTGVVNLLAPTPSPGIETGGRCRAGFGCGRRLSLNPISFFSSDHRRMTVPVVCALQSAAGLADTLSKAEDGPTDSNVNVHHRGHPCIQKADVRNPRKPPRMLAPPPACAVTQSFGAGTAGRTASALTVSRRSRRSRLTKPCTSLRPPNTGSAQRMTCNLQLPTAHMPVCAVGACGNRGRNRGPL